MTRHYIFSLISLFAIIISNAQITFTNNANALGVNYHTGTSPWGNGVTFYDYNQDGWDDITINGGTGERLRFFKNINGTFVEEELLDPAITYRTKQINWVDFDNDGDKDLFVTSDTDGNRLYENKGNGFDDITTLAGIPTINMYTYGASWGDYNNDGFLDVYVSNRDEVTFTTPNFLYKNNGDGTFTDVSLTLGLNTTAHSSFCSAFFDFNNDGWQDLFVANDRYIYENYLYKNNGDGTFTDIGASSGVGVFMDAMSATIDDFNHDGWMDIYVTNTTDGNRFFKNNGDETFTDISVSAGTTFNSIAWGAVFLDAENDMDLDLYVSGRLDPTNPTLIPYAFYENNNDGTFSEPTSTGLEVDNRSSYSNAIGDINNDGLFDILVANNNDKQLFLWENTTSTTNNWLKIELEGTTSNKDGVGSVIEISVNGNKQYRYTLCGEGYLSQNSGFEIFGLGANTLVDYVKVTWLSGIVDTYNNVSANQTLSIVENSETLSVINENIDNNINVFPNPVSNSLNVSTTLKPSSIQLFNNIGQQLFNITKTSLVNHIDVSNLDSGIYYLKVISDKKNKVLKIIKD